MARLVKIVTFAPEAQADVVRKAMGDAGAGEIGNYDHCSFSSKGTGRFTPQKCANPTIGKVGKAEQVQEERIEVVCLGENAKKVIEAVKKVHPYEEVAIDIYPLISEEEL